ncbi:hypothetical protein ACFXKW_27415 [Streptomyces sp. NPDC059193]|uniref:hypothetical protein n=1 Tax=Streptomyces sp. NPDC059193 TaxID=3346763 RepID=UPI0036AEE697
MTTISRSDAALGAALALAAHYFPATGDDGMVVASFRRAAFFLTGQLDKWPGWRAISHEERQRIAAVLRLAPTDLGTTWIFTARARERLSVEQEGLELLPFALVGEPHQAQGAIPRVGGDYLGYVDRVLERVAKAYKRRTPGKPATPGTWLTKPFWGQGGGLVQGRADIPDFGSADTADAASTTGGPEHFPEVSTVPYHPEIGMSPQGLLDLAARIDQRYQPKDRYLRQVLAGLFAQLQTSDSIGTEEMLRMVAGPVEVLNAPTGTGKSVLVRVAAAWFALNDMHLSIVLPTVDATLSMAWDISQDLAHLGRPGACTPLMSPNGLHDRALKTAARLDGPLAEQSPKATWRLDQLMYGCALQHFTESDRPYPSGGESCRSLSPLPPSTGIRTCPWMPACGKYAQQYRACTASVIVTNHHNFMSGRIHIGVVLDGRPTGDLSVAEFVLRRSHAVMIDEVDQFQSTAVDKCSSQLVLDSRREHKVPLRELDEDKSRLSPEAVKDLCPTVSHARYLSEFLLASICENQIHLRHYEGTGPAREHAGANSTGWHLAGGRDRRLITLLFPDAGITSEQEIPLEYFALLRALHPASPTADDAEMETGDDSALPADLEPVRETLAVLLAPRGEDLLSQVQLDLNDLLGDIVKEPHERSEAVELLIIRTWLAELDQVLARLRSKTAQLRSAGMRSAATLAEKLEGGVAGDILPFGMLGRSIVGYRVTGLDDKAKSAELTSQSISGDPHTYTAQLGSVISLVLAGVERPVMGLSATAYFPQAVREHIHGPVKWWMTDAAPDSIRAQKQAVTNTLNEPIQISGIPQFLKRKALTLMGERLYDTQIHPELTRLEQTDPDRAHAAVVVNSYEHCRYIANGIRDAGEYRGGLCVAVPSEKHRRTGLPELRQGVVELTPEEFEDFPNRGKILVVPMARIARGLNIVIGTKSAITPVYVCTRPLALLTDPPEMYASVNVAGLNTLSSASADHAEPAELFTALDAARTAAWERLGMIMRSAPGFISTHKQLQEEIVAGLVVDMIQLAGRARRGGTDMTLHLVDYAFHQDSWQSDLAHILRRMHANWPPAVRRRMNAIYREALVSFLAYAGVDLAPPPDH